MRTLFAGLLALTLMSSSAALVAMERKPFLLGGARIGDSLEKVANLVRSAKPPEGEKRTIHGTTCELERKNYTTGGMEMDECYYFRDGKLVMIRVHADVTEMAKERKSLTPAKRTLLANGCFNESVKRLTERYGQPTLKDGNRSAAYYRWERANGVVIELSHLRWWILSTSVRFSDGSLPSASPVPKKK